MRNLTIHADSYFVRVVFSLRDFPPTAPVALLRLPVLMHSLIEAMQSGCHVLCLMIFSNFFVIWHKSLAFSLVFLRFSQVLTAFVKCRHNPFKGHLSLPFPPFSFLNHTETNIVSKLLSAFKHSFTLSVSILLHACQSHLLLSVDKTKLALLRNNRLFWELYYFLNIVQISCRVN